jgi:hypothetical protein
MRKPVPGALWVALIALGLISLVQLLIGMGQGKPTLLITVALNAAIWLGLYAGHRWAYVALIVVSGLSVIVIAARNPAQALGVLIVDAVVVIPVIMATSYFWNRESPADASRQ